MKKKSIIVIVCVMLFFACCVHNPGPYPYGSQDEKDMDQFFILWRNMYRDQQAERMDRKLNRIEQNQRMEKMERLFESTPKKTYQPPPLIPSKGWQK